MGIIDPNFPKDCCLKLAEIAKADIFTETGTYLGETTKWAATKFDKVHTIELSDYFYNQVREELISKGNITPHLGNSIYVLPEILKSLNGNIVFWLDGHHCVPGTGGVPGSCPLLKELEIILQRNNDDIIIIDDARLLGGVGGEEWPSFLEIFRMVENIQGQARFIQICDDNLYIIPNKSIYMEILYDYILTRLKLLWELDYYKHHKKSLRRSFIDFVMMIGKKTGTYNILRQIYRKIFNKKTIKNNLVL